MNIEDKIRILLIELVEDLVNRNYSKIVTESRNGQLTEDVIERVNQEYSEFWDTEGVLTTPPTTAFKLIKNALTEWIY